MPGNTGDGGGYDAAHTRISTGAIRTRSYRSGNCNVYAEKQGWQNVQVYQDVMSGAKSSRPALNRLMADSRARKFDCLLVWKTDRFGQSLVDCLNNIRTLEENGVRFIAVTQGLDTGQQNPASRFLLRVLGTSAEFERSLIRERTQAGRLRYQLGLCCRASRKGRVQPVWPERGAAPPTACR